MCEKTEFNDSWLAWDDSTFAELRDSEKNAELVIVEYQLHGRPDLSTFTGTESQCNHFAYVLHFPEEFSQISIKKVQ